MPYVWRFSPKNFPLHTSHNFPFFPATKMSFPFYLNPLTNNILKLLMKYSRKYPQFKRLERKIIHKIRRRNFLSSYLIFHPSGVFYCILKLLCIFYFTNKIKSIQIISGIEEQTFHLQKFHPAKIILNLKLWTQIYCLFNFFVNCWINNKWNKNNYRSVCVQLLLYLRQQIQSFPYRYLLEKYTKKMLLHFGHLSK